MIENISIKVDDVGRIVIPKKVRKELDINIDDILLLSVKNNKIEMEKRDNNYKLERLINKLQNLTEDHNLDIILTDNIKVIFSNIIKLNEQKININKKEFEINRVIKINKTPLTKEFEITQPHYYCCFYLNIYTRYNLFVIYKTKKDEKLAKTICELILI